MADAIAAEVLRRLPGGIAGLQIRFLDELARAIVNAAGQFPRVATDIEHRLAMRMAVRTIEHPMMEGRGIASMLERSYRDVRDGGLTVDEFEARAKRLSRSKLIVRAWREYERLIASYGAVDGADLLARAAVLAGSGGVRPQILAGFYDMTGVQATLVDALPVVERWAPVAASPQRKAAAEPSHSKTSFDTRFAELRAVCAEVAELLRRRETSIAIVGRSLEPYDARLINRFAREFGFQTTLAEEMPLKAHRIGRAVLTLLRLRERGFPRADVLELVRDGLHLRTRIDVDAVDAATRRARVAGGTSEELRVLRNRSRLIDDYIALVAEVESLDPTNVGSLAKIETAEDLAAAELLDEIRDVFVRANALNDTPSLIDAIEHATLTHRLPPTADRPLIYAGPLLNFRGRTVDHLFVVGMQDDVFPQGRFEDPLIPDSERARIGLREIGDGAEEERLLLQLLFDSAEKDIRFTYATGDGFGKVLRQSRFLRAVGSLPQHQATEQPSNQATQRQLQLLVQAGTQSPFDGYVPSLRPFVEAKLGALSPTQLEDFGECPHKFLLKHILDVEDLDHPEREIQVHHRDKGTLDHRVLERFYRGLTDADREAAIESLPRLPESLVARLEQFIDDAFDHHETDVPPFNRTVRGIERRATKRILREFVINDLADLAANELVPKHFEYQFGSVSARRANPSSPAFTLDTGNVTLRVEGTIDRVDAGGGKLRIVDYKSGKALRHDRLADKIDRGVRLQLALYAMAASNIFGVDAENVAGTIKPIVTGEGKSRFAFALHEKQERLLETLALFTKAIRDCVFPAFPGREDDVDSCKYCPVNHSCRTRHDLEERYAIQQQRDPRTLLDGGA